MHVEYFTFTSNAFFNQLSGWNEQTHVAKMKISVHSLRNSGVSIYSLKKVSFRPFFLHIVV